MGALKLTTLLGPMLITMVAALMLVRNLLTVTTAEPVHLTPAPFHAANATTAVRFQMTCARTSALTVLRSRALTRMMTSVIVINTALEWGIAALDATMRMPALGEMGEMVILARDRSIEHPVLLETLARARTMYHPVLLDQTVVKFCNLSLFHFVNLFPCLISLSYLILT